MSEIGEYNRNTGFIAGVSAATAIFTEVLGKSEMLETNQFLDTINWFGKAGLAWAGLRVVNASISVMGRRLDRDSEGKWQEVLADLPMLERPFSPLQAVAEIERVERNREISQLSQVFSMTRQAARSVESEEGSFLAYWSLREDVNRAVVDLAAEKKKSTGKQDNYFTAGARVVEMSQVLDRVAPISIECPKTPQRSFSGKFWYQFIDDRAEQIETFHS